MEGNGVNVVRCALSVHPTLQLVILCEKVGETCMVDQRKICHFYTLDTRVANQAEKKTVQTLSRVRIIMADAFSL